MADLSREYPFYQYMSGRGGYNNQPNSYLNFQPYIPTFIGKPVQDIANTYEAYSNNLKYIHDVKDALDVAMSDVELGLNPADMQIAEDRKLAIRSTVEQIADSGNFRAAGLLINKALKEFQADTRLKSAAARSADYEAKRQAIIDNPEYTAAQKRYYSDPRHFQYLPTDQAFQQLGYYPKTVDAPIPATKYDYHAYLLQLANSFESDIAEQGFTPYGRKGKVDLLTGDLSEIIYWREGTSETITRGEVIQALKQGLQTNTFADQFITDLVKVEYDDIERANAEIAAANGVQYDYNTAMQQRKDAFLNEIISPYADAKDFTKTRAQYTLNPRGTGNDGGGSGVVRSSGVTTGVSADNKYGKLGNYLTRQTILTTEQIPGGSTSTGSTGYIPVYKEEYKPVPSEMAEMVNRLAHNIPYVNPDGTVEYYNGPDITKEPDAVKDKFYPGVKKFVDATMAGGPKAVAVMNSRNGKTVEAISEELFGKHNGKAGSYVNTLLNHPVLDYETGEVVDPAELTPKGLKGDDDFPRQVISVMSPDNPFVLATGDNRFALSYVVQIGDKKYVVGEAEYLQQQNSDGTISDYDITWEWETKNEINNVKYTNDPRSGEKAIDLGEGYTIEVFPAYDYTTLIFKAYGPDGSEILSGVSASGDEIFRMVTTKILNNQQ